MSPNCQIFSDSVKKMFEEGYIQYLKKRDRVKGKEKTIFVDVSKKVRDELRKKMNEKKSKNKQKALQKFYADFYKERKKEYIKSLYDCSKFKLPTLFYLKGEINEDYFLNINAFGVNFVEAILRMYINEIHQYKAITHSPKMYHQDAELNCDMCVPFNTTNTSSFVESENTRTIYDSSPIAQDLTINAFLQKINSIMIDGISIFHHFAEKTSIAKELITEFNYTDKSLDDVSVIFQTISGFYLPKQFSDITPLVYFHVGNNKYERMYIMPNTSMLLKTNYIIENKTNGRYLNAVQRNYGDKSRNYGTALSLQKTKKALTCMPMKFNEKYDDMSQNDFFTYCLKKNYSSMIDFFDGIAQSISKYQNSFLQKKIVLYNIRYMVDIIFSARNEFVKNEYTITNKNANHYHKMWLQVEDLTTSKKELRDELTRQFIQWFIIEYNKYIQAKNIIANIPQSYVSHIVKMFYLRLIKGV